MSVFDKLTEGIVNRDLAQEGAALLTKWEKTGLLEGLESDHKRAGMARLLENQAKQLLKETSSMAAGGSAGDVQGFSAVAFPLVRRVFAGLFANDIVSVQPMSLPSGLIFFLDFTTSADGPGLPRLGYPSAADDRSLFGGRRVGAQITGGLDLSDKGTELGPYSLNNGYASPTGSDGTTVTVIVSGTVGDSGAATVNGGGITLAKASSILRYDPDLTSGSAYVIATCTPPADFDYDNMIALTVQNSASIQARRLTQLSGTSQTVLLTVFSTPAVTSPDDLETLVQDTNGINYPQKDVFQGGSAVGSVNATEFGLENETLIPEIDIKVDSVAVTAQTKKLKAKWTPELGQDLNAYQPRR